MKKNTAAAWPGRGSIHHPPESLLVSGRTSETHNCLTRRQKRWKSIHTQLGSSLAAAPSHVNTFSFSFFFFPRSGAARGVWRPAGRASTQPRVESLLAGAAVGGEAAEGQAVSRRPWLSVLRPFRFTRQGFPKIEINRGQVSVFLVTPQKNDKTKIRVVLNHHEKDTHVSDHSLVNYARLPAAPAFW